MAKEKAPTKTELKAQAAQEEAKKFKELGVGDEVFYPPFHEKGEYPVISKQAAVILGFRRFFTGEPCVHGHVAPRKTSTSRCIKCQAASVAARAKKVREEKKLEA